MKDFKTKEQMKAGHYCWGGKIMKKAKGGYAEGNMRSESTQMARASRDLSDAYDDAKPSYNPIKNIGEIMSGRAMEQGANLSNALDRKKRAEQETGGYKKGGKAMKKAEGGTVRSRFNSAFAEARNRGDKTFDFEGKKYTSEMAKPQKPMAGRSKPETEVNDYKDDTATRPSVEESTVKMPGGTRPSMEDTTSQRGMPVKTKMEDLESLLPKKSAVQPDFDRKKYGMPGIRMGEEGEPAIVIGKKRGGMAKGGNWIAGAVKNKGALHRSLGVPEGQKIPSKKLNAAMKSDNPTVAKRARLAKTLKSFNKG